MSRLLAIIKNFITKNNLVTLRTTTQFSPPKSSDLSGQMSKDVSQVDVKGECSKQTGLDSSKESPAKSRADLPEVDILQRYFAQKLGISDDKEKYGMANKKVYQVLDDVSVDGIVSYIKQTKCKNIITMAGAGISTSAGIPDFRTPGHGLYDNLASYNLPYPQAVFEIDFFRKKPEPFFRLAKDLYPGSYKPTLSHYFIKLLSDKGLLLRHYTQNIDMLERKAGVPSEKIVEAHGTFHTSHCLNKACNAEYDLEWMKEHIFNDKTPYCVQCKTIVKPDIIFFGEELPTRFGKLMQEDFVKCDLLIILGTSLVVQPFASLVDRVPNSCPRLLINREKAGSIDPLTLVLGLTCGLDFDSSDNYRDVALLGSCDEGCSELITKLDWKEDLNKLMEEQASPNNTVNHSSKEP